MVAALVMGACGDDDKPTDTGVDATETSEVEIVPEVDETAEVDEVETIDEASDVTEVDETTPFVLPTPIAVPLSATTADQLQAVVAAPGGKFYAVGFVAAGLAGSDARKVIIVRVGPTGLDATFGDAGIVETTLDFRGANDELDIALDSQGRIVVSAVVANATTPADTDIAVLRMSAEGVPDAAFGDAGIVVVDLNDGLIDGTTVTGGDRVRGLAIDAQDRVYLHSVRLADAPRTDTDFSVVRLTADGDRDASFAGGEFLLDLRGAAPAEIPSNATPRGIVITADGGVLAGGYATTDGFGPNPQAVVYKLDGDGVLVDAFDGDGVFHDIVLSTQTEVYGIALHGAHFVTGGYGREDGDQNDWVMMKFDTTTGARDTSFGDAPNGAVLVDPSGAMVGDNCRNAIALPGGKTLLIGSAGPNNQVAQDAAFVVLDAAGKLDVAYGDGAHTIAFGADGGGNDQLWGAAVSGDFALLVGYRGGGAAADQTADKNDDAFMMLLPLQ